MSYLGQKCGDKQTRIIIARFSLCPIVKYDAVVRDGVKSKQNLGHFSAKSLHSFPIDLISISFLCLSLSLWISSSPLVVYII